MHDGSICSTGTQNRVPSHWGIGSGFVIQVPFFLVTRLHGWILKTIFLQQKTFCRQIIQIVHANNGRKRDRRDDTKKSSGQKNGAAMEGLEKLGSRNRETVTIVRFTGN